MVTAVQSRHSSWHTLRNQKRRKNAPKTRNKNVHVADCERAIRIKRPLVGTTSTGWRWGSASRSACILAFRFTLLGRAAVYVHRDTAALVIPSVWNRSRGRQCKNNMKTAGSTACVPFLARQIFGVSFQQVPHKHGIGGRWQRQVRVTPNKHDARVVDQKPHLGHLPWLTLRHDSGNPRAQDWAAQPKEGEIRDY